MNKKNFISVGFEFPGDCSDYYDFDSENSLLDADIIVFLPTISSFLSYTNSQYLGKPSLSESISFTFKERVNHWRSELTEAFNCGKTIFFLLDEFQELFVDTGKRKYSGTGKNEKETILVEKTNNYNVLPFDLPVRTSKGNKMFLYKEETLLNNYWKTFAKYSSYKVIIEGEATKKLLTSKDGSVVFGAILLNNSSSGSFVLLPSLDVDDDIFLEEKKDEYYWTEEAVVFGKNLLKEFLEIDKNLKSSGAKTPRPSWVSNSEYEIEIEKKSFEQLNRIENDIKKLNVRKDLIKNKLRKETDIKNLLYENGKTLEKVVLEALKLLGFRASNYKESDSEFDVVFESPEGRFLGEVEGKDSKAINIDKLRQLEMNIHEDFSREEVNEPAKGVLFGNAYRLLPPNERDEFFTEKCKVAAGRSKTALVKTIDLFFIAKYLKQRANISFSKKCRMAIFEAEGGTIKFPEIPVSKSKNIKALEIGKNT